MKKIIVLAIIIFSFSFLYSQSSHQGKALIMVDPTLTKIKDISTLVEKKCIDVPNLKIIGLYNKRQKINVSESAGYIQSNNLNYIELRGVDMNISMDSLFQSNSCTSSFYQLFKETDGIIFTGGPDIPPVLYGEKTGLNTEIEPFERLYELSFLYHLAGSSQPFLDQRKDYLVFCICLGMQNLNVALGGTLYQDIPSQIYSINSAEEVLSKAASDQHRNYSSDLWNKDELTSYVFHPLKIVSGTFLSYESFAKTGKEPEIMSSHHQCIRKLADGLKIAATSMDGKIIEAVYSGKYPNLLAVQFHPENRYLYDGSTRIFGKDGAKVRAEEVVSGENLDFNREIWHYISQRINAQMKN